MLFSITPLQIVDPSLLASLESPFLHTMASPVSETFKQLLKKQQEDPLCVKLVQQLEANILPDNDPIRSRYSVHDCILMWTSNGRLCIVVQPPLSTRLLSEAHDSNVSGHLGVDKTYNTLSEVYYWSGMH
eukprot:909569-Rhodomonas_salina.3